MLDVKFIRENVDLVKENCKKRGYDVDIDEIVELDAQRRSLIGSLDPIRSERKKLAKQWHNATEEQKARSIELGKEEDEITEKLREVEASLDEKLPWVPNMLDERVPLGDEDNTVVLKTVGDKPNFEFAPRPHEELGMMCNILDIERGVKAAKSRFYLLKNEAVRMRLALTQMFIDRVEGQGFELITPPFLTKDETLFASGYYPFATKDNFKVEDDNLSLIGTSEQNLIGMHMDEVLDRLPLLYLGDSMCFRTEVGSAGKDTSGIIRTHQFYKMEQIVYCRPEDSEEWHLKCQENAEWLVSTLGIPYQTVLLAAFDLAAPGHIKYDIEAWFPSQGRYRELTSNTNLTDYQTRRGKIRFKIDKERGYPHTISATGFTDRLILAIWENYQQADGSIKVPEALVPYMGGKEVIAAKG